MAVMRLVVDYPFDSLFQSVSINVDVTLSLVKGFRYKRCQPKKKNIFNDAPCKLDTGVLILCLV